MCMASRKLYNLGDLFCIGSVFANFCNKTFHISAKVSSNDALVMIFIHIWRHSRMCQTPQRFRNVIKSFYKQFSSSRNAKVHNPHCLQRWNDANKSRNDFLEFSFCINVAKGLFSAILARKIFDDNSSKTGDEIESQQANIQGFFSDSSWLPVLM